MIGGSSIRLGSGGSGAGLGFQRAAAGGATNQQPRKCQASDQGGGFDSRARSFPVLFKHYHCHHICILEGMYVLGVLIVMIGYYTFYIYDDALLYIMYMYCSHFFNFHLSHATFSNTRSKSLRLDQGSPKQLTQ